MRSRRRYVPAAGTVADRALSFLAQAPGTAWLSREVAAAVGCRPQLHALLGTAVRHGLVDLSFRKAPRHRHAAQWRITAAGLEVLGRSAVGAPPTVDDDDDDDLGPLLAQGYGTNPPGQDLWQAWRGA